MDQLFPFPRTGNSFLDILKDPFSRKIFGHEAAIEEDSLPFILGLAARLDFLIRNPANHLSLFKLGYTALEAFLQSNVTGPPLDFDPKDVIFPKIYHTSVSDLRKQLFASLSVQGEAVYSLTPHIELFWVAKTIVSNDELCEGFNGRRARMRVNFWHQKLLSESSDYLRDQINNDAEVLEGQLTSRLVFQGAAAEYHFVEFLVERSVIDVYYGNDIQARTHLAKAAKVRGFEFALTGALGKRTKFQDRDVSQLVVLARSGKEEIEEPSSRKGSRADTPTGSLQPSMVEPSSRKGSHAEPTTPRSEPEKRLGSPAVTPLKKPENIPLNDDTLLESIHFAPPKLLPEAIPDSEDLPPSLSELDPSSQPLLHPFDSIILLQIASSISNTLPSDGLTREETVPYAIRVLEGGSSNWQVYTQALLIRSRIEGYRSRTAERGLLQLQALVDQVIVETTTKTGDTKGENVSLAESDINSDISEQKERSRSRSRSPTTAGPTSFLPAARPSESAPVAERLKYIYQLHPPLRWELEAELAARWVSMGGLKTALEIYERLQMHAEVALCLAATNKEAKAIRVTRKLLFEPSPGEGGNEHEFTGSELDTLPPDAPRLFCILGDLENSPEHYERAWTVSEGRYARAQRSLGRYHVHNKNYPLAVGAYAKSLEVNRLNASTWFALGCVQLELEDFEGAVESFTRTVQLETDDAEAWSNLAAALLRLPEAEDEEEKRKGKKSIEEEEAAAAAAVAAPPIPSDSIDEVAVEENSTSSLLPPPQSTTTTMWKQPDPNKPLKDALHALRRAARLKHNDARIWDNYLTVAASIPPPDTPWSEIILAQKRLIELRGKSIGEKAVDEKILTVLVRYVVQEFEYPQPQTSKEVPPASAIGAAAKPEEAEGETNTRHPPTKAESNPNNDTPHLPPYSHSSLLLSLIDHSITPLLTQSAPLYLLLADLNLWRHRPLAALQAHEKAWRAVTGRAGVYEGAETGWEGVVDATVRLVEAYEKLGVLRRERGGVGGLEVVEEAEARELVAKDWRFKAQSAIRGVMGKGRASWEGSPGWERLRELAERLKSKQPEG